MEIKKVLMRRDGKMKFVIIPIESDIEKGDYVKIEKIDSSRAKGTNKEVDFQNE